MDANSITPEIRKFIADKIANGETVRVEWLTHEILERHAGIEGDDRDFYLICARAHVREIVKRCVGKYDNHKSTDEQLVLAGFDHLQVAYTVERDSATILVPVDQVSDEELLARAAEYDDMAKGCRAHAREIRKYVETRLAQAA